MFKDNRAGNWVRGWVFLVGFFAGLLDGQAQTNDYSSRLEEVVVSAQKREQSNQEAPIAISVLNDEQLELQGIANLRDLENGAVPSLRVMPFGSTPSNIVFGIRGNAPRDSSEVTREATVGVYLDGVYMARSQALGLDLIDLERIEILRGPQGSLFGRNAVGGAVSLISKKPSGEFGIKQTLTMGRFDELRSLTHIDLPEIAGISAKLDYLHSERSGWVNNTDPDESDYHAYDKDGGRLSLYWQVSDSVNLEYGYDQSNVLVTHDYYQLYVDRIGVFGDEPERQTETRLPLLLEPTETDTSGHSVVVSWQASESVTFKSISAYRDLQEDSNSNYGGVLYFNGLNDSSVMDQDQLTQEFQLIGTRDRIDWVAGLYYLQEEVDRTAQFFFTLDIFDAFGNGALSPIDPPTTFDALGAGADLPPRIVDAESNSQAIYGQVTWNPDLLGDKLFVTLGGRQTEDERTASRLETTLSESDQDSGHFDTTLVLGCQWQDHLSTYFKRSTAYKAGGVNTRSASFAPFSEEVAETFEIGLKSEFWGQRARLNLAIFETDYEDMQLDFNDPVTIGLVETINAENDVSVDGLEMDLTIAPLTGLIVGVSYTYLDSDMPLQPNPLDGGALREFFVTLAPKHAGAMTLDYRLKPWRFGTLSMHMDMTSTDDYSFSPYGEQLTEAYTLFNARLTLSDVDIGGNRGSLKASLWGQNLFDEEYIVDASPIGDPAVAIIQAFGDPRTLGLDITYQF